MDKEGGCVRIGEFLRYLPHGLGGPLTSVIPEGPVAIKFTEDARVLGVGPVAGSHPLF